ncbi:MAG: RHS repeat-associated core domain-containing protein, partial [Nitrospira sp.]|nr:RHS repeat-associated core domain-containing protein [Nitrospira sp.]
GRSRRGDNPQYQLSRAEYPSALPFNGEIHSWSYDAIGNRLTNTVNAATQNYTYLKNGQNPLNGQKLANDGTSAYTYDFNGNTLTRTGYGFAYDAENRLTAITGNEAATYTYDYQGRRTSKTIGGVTTTYLYDGLNLIAETAVGATSYFLNGAGIDEPLTMSKAGQISYLVADGLGSIVATNDPTGTVTHSVVFDAWGITRSEIGTRMHPFTYTGREVGDAGLLFYRARYYSPATGRFGSEDPLGMIADQALYRYVHNKAVSLVDALGWAETKPIPGVNGGRYRMDVAQGGQPNMHIYWPDGQESVVSINGGFLQKHGGNELTPPVKGLLPKVRGLIREFLKKPQVKEAREALRKKNACKTSKAGVVLNVLSLSVGLLEDLDRFLRADENGVDYGTQLRYDLEDAGPFIEVDGIGVVRNPYWPPLS